MRPIDADGFLDRNAEFANREFIHPKYQATLRELVDSEPTLTPDEVRGVVKCKDCTFGESATDGDGNPCVLCGNSMVFDYPYAHDPDWFCADGEMKGAESETTE